MIAVLTQPKHQCIKCHRWYTDAFFALSSPGNFDQKSYRRLRCIGCMQTQRDKTKQDGQRLLMKARSAFHKHAAKFKSIGVITEAQDLASTFGWNVAQMAHDIAHAVQNGCPYCYRPFASMANGLGDVSLDVVDPEALPYYRTNTRWVCRTCNNAKAKTKPALFAEKLANWDEWRRGQADDPFAGTLLEGIPDLHEE